MLCSRIVVQRSSVAYEAVDPGCKMKIDLSMINLKTSFSFSSRDPGQTGFWQANNSSLLLGFRLVVYPQLHAMTLHGTEQVHLPIDMYRILPRHTS
jgi:hypothetical protein